MKNSASETNDCAKDRYKNNEKSRKQKADIVLSMKIPLQNLDLIATVLGDKTD